LFEKKNVVVVVMMMMMMIRDDDNHDLERWIFRLMMAMLIMTGG